MKEWRNRGSETEVIRKKMAAICLCILLVYRLGYACGALLVHLGF